MSNWPLFPSGGRIETIGEVSGEGTTLTPDTASKGAYATIGTTGFDWDNFYVQVVTVANQTNLVDIAIGANDQIIFPDMAIHANNVGGNLNVEFIQVPVTIPAGTAVKARALSNNTGNNLRVMITGQNGGLLMPPSASRVVPLTGFSGVWSTSGTTFSGTAGVNTAWIEVTASCPADLAGFYVVPSPDNDTTRTAGRFVIDVGIGALGSEVVRWSFQGAQSAGGIAGPFIGPIFDAIPAGSRIVWRARRAGGGIDAIACIFYGLAA